MTSLLPRIAVLSTMFALTACTASVPTPSEPELPIPELPVPEDHASSAVMNASSVAPTGETTSSAPSPAARVIRLEAKNWAFSPDVITVKKGEKVTIELVGVEGTHGFTVPDLGINQPVSAGQTVSIDVPTDQVGTHNFFCSIPCGSGHSGMHGKIVVTE